MAASGGPPQREQEKDFEKGKWPFGGEGTPDTVPIPSGDGCVRISEVLGRADKEVGEYSFGGKADSLPAVPGICINDVGTISVPFQEHDATKLIEKCEKSPFGHNFDTKMDDNVRKSWQLEPSQVEFKNPLWESGLHQLTRTITERLGYSGVPLQCVLYKLLVYEEGGHFFKHQDTEKEDGMIATLVVQLPSLHEGGDLVIYSNGEVKHRHDFGKADGTVAFLPHYAVHYADAEHALETVTKGFRLALVYSICLPKDRCQLKRVFDKPLSDDLVGAIGMVSDGDESFALLLSHEYTEKSIEEFGCEALKGVDRVRFGALEEANALVAPDKKLKFYIVELTHYVLFAEHYDEAGWFEEEREQSIAWYNYRPDPDDSIQKVEKTEATLNFLNPARETLTQLWMPHGVKELHAYTGNEGPSSSTKYSRFAIVAWPESRHAENALEFLPMDLACKALNARKPFDASTLRVFLNQVDKRFKTEVDYSSPYGFSIEFCLLFCELVLEAGDSDLVSFFFTKLCPKLGDIEENETLIPLLVAIIQKYDWSKIGTAVLASLSKALRSSSTTIKRDKLSEVELTLRVIDALDDGEAQTALLEMVLEKAMKLKDELFCAPKVVPLLCKWSRRSSDPSKFKAYSDKLMKMDPSLLGSVIEGISKLFADEDKTGELYELVNAQMPKRIEWLDSQIPGMSKSFTWEMPDGKFCESPEIEKFLKGPEEEMDTKNAFGFDDLKQAQDYAVEGNNEDRDDASFTMEAVGSDKEAYLKITKTRKWFDDRQKKLEQYKAEVAGLMERFGEKMDRGDMKRARHE
ncbi:uncharacterized protein PITG_07148 [Phytophthora infestans T30-4]|uniref:Fe2OG dioxygenase domain-containing protein n=1 Tax=Phytophthora infestans (strain T30-4) TaxID=403677 RepID=D0N7E1_PHYIT|nr:uncharacterized protein PITG_07148 [Phytophthora infestans T30-4]EEY53490.1 conserved hypothetical protein [Phytophthora infestans T30-4]|eukprot:XP_002905108.1 conserved hypothetical protein [Phytophthora infestans T30-4]